MTAQRVTVPVPAETGVEDRLAGALTFRHAAYLAVAAAGLAVMLLGDRSIARLVVGAVVSLVGVAGAAVRPYGEPLDRLVPAALLYLRRRRAERHPAASGEAEVAASPPTESEAEVEPPVPESDSDDVVASQRRVSLRPLVPVLAAVAVVAVAVARWPHQVPQPAPRVVVVPVPVEVVDPWGEAIDDAVDAWLNDISGT